jgi:LysR family hydrogen peroxide-inducible transcriptional activator
MTTLSPLAPHPFSLRQLQYVVTVADTLSFRRAAKRCFVSQPSLSTQIALVETALGVRIFERDRRRVLVTTAGQLLVDRARRILIESDDLVLVAKRAGDPLAGTLRIGVIPTVSPYLLPAVTPRLRAEFPRLSIAWLEEKTDVLVSALQSGTIEAAILALEAEIGDVEREVIARDPFMLVMRPDHPLGNKTTPVAATAFRGTDVLLLDDGHCFRDQALEVCAMARAHEGEFRATSLPTLVQMVAGGAGVTLLPALAVPTEVARARLRVRPVISPGAHRTIALIWRKQSPLGATLRKIAGVVRDAYPTGATPTRRSAKPRTRAQKT